MLYKKPDLHKSRRRYNLKCKIYPNRELLDAYLKKHPNSSINTGTIMRKVHNAIIDEVRDTVINHRDGFMFPKFGIMMIVARKDKGLYYNRKKSIETGEWVKIMNLTTDFKRARVVFARDGIYRITNGKYYYFDIVKEFKQLVSKNFVTKYNDYVVIENRNELIKHIKNICHEHN